ncbi:MAG: chemotaxis protein CheX [SAR324 cluster bacterium]|nr:chemotaxis protein CheX [SAR324 cluster bacterium]
MNNAELREKLKTHIINAVSESMEMFFVDAEHMGEYLDYSEGIDWINMDALYAEILIFFPFSGELRLIMPRQLVVTMAENVYSMEEEPSEQILDDLIAETLNVIAGRLLASMLPPSERFKFGLPELGEDSFLETDAFSEAVDFDAEGIPLWVVACGEGFLEYV